MPDGKTIGYAPWDDSRLISSLTPHGRLLLAPSDEGPEPERALAERLTGGIALGVLLPGHPQELRALVEEQGPRAGRALVALLERTGGLDIFTGMLARFSTPATVPAVGAFVTGLLSTFSSTSYVVLPAFLPTVSGLVAKLGGGDPVAIAASMSIGAQLTDVSPLSALGALCIAGAAPREDPRALFNSCWHGGCP